MQAVQPALVQRDPILDAIRGHVAADVVAKATMGRLGLVDRHANAAANAAFVGVDVRAELNAPMRKTDCIPAPVPLA